MKMNWRNALMGLSMAAGLLTIAPSCVVRARVSPVMVTDSAPPDASPRYERPAPRSGYVWIQGRYEYRGSRYVWTRGKWKRARSGQRWQAGRWEQRGRRWHWVRGSWARGARVNATGTVNRPPVRDNRTRPPVRDNRTRPPVRDNRPPPPPVVTGPPRQAPPSPRYKIVNARPGFHWLKGHWEWNSGRWVWTTGRWEKARRGYRWQPANWQLRGNVYIKVKGSWVINRR